MISLSDIRERLGQRGCRVTGGPTQWSAQCPAHEDDRPSLRLASGQDGRPLLHCMAGCTPDDVLGALELTWSDVLPPRAEQSGERPQHVATYVYRDLGGKPLYEVRRFTPKTFRPYLPGAPRAGLPPNTPRVLYRLPEVAAAISRGEPIYICEGEKDADALSAVLGPGEGTATCPPGGAGQRWRPEYTGQLAGAREVRIIADRDDAGIKHARGVADALAEAIPTIRVLLPRPRHHGADTADHLALGFGVGDLEPLGDAETDQPTLTADGLEPIIIRADSIPVEYPDWLWENRLPAGALVVLDGLPGAGKTALALDLAARLTTGQPWPDGEPSPGPAGAVIMPAEDSPATLLHRLRAANADLTRIAVLREARGVRDGALITRPITLADTGAIRAAITAVDAKLVIVDPITAFLGDINPDKDTQVRTLLTPLAALAQETGAAILLIRHPRKAGGAALTAGAGSIGIIGAARVGWTAGPHPDPEAGVQVLAVSKTNLGPVPKPLAYEVRPVPIPGAPPNRLGRIPTTATLGWVDVDLAGLTADALTDRETAAQVTKAGEAAQWLIETLRERGGSAPRAEIFAADPGFGRNALDRARRQAGIRSVSSKSWPRYTEWVLPGATTAEEGHAPPPPTPDASAGSALPDGETLLNLGEGADIAEWVS